jgi:hypothetical protein
MQLAVVLLLKCGGPLKKLRPRCHYEISDLCELPLSFKYDRFSFTTLFSAFITFRMGLVKASSIAIGLLLSTGVTPSPTPPLEKRCDCSLDPRSGFMREILAKSNYPSHPTIPTPPDVPLKVGIIGAGAAGLYSAVLLDSLGIDYDILEASGRVGGRIYTYRFNETAWDASTPDDPDFYDYYVSLSSLRFL